MYLLTNLFKAASNTCFPSSVCQTPSLTCLSSLLPHGFWGPARQMWRRTRQHLLGRLFQALQTNRCLFSQPLNIRGRSYRQLLGSPGGAGEKTDSLSVAEKRDSEPHPLHPTWRKEFLTLTSSTFLIIYATFNWALGSLQLKRVPLLLLYFSSPHVRTGSFYWDYLIWNVR